MHSNIETFSTPTLSFSIGIGKDKLRFDMIFYEIHNSPYHKENSLWMNKYANSILLNLFSIGHGCYFGLLYVPHCVGLSITPSGSDAYFDAYVSKDEN